ncbi:MAG TPA: short chain dehydrogenase [Cryomorphaceae bacterium]|nr:short chain dehydrogenase [Cryomorphaceae bacterium]
MKIILVGASGTIGTAVKALFESQGHEVLPASRNGKLSVDIRDAASIQHMFATHGPVDMVVSTAGDALYGDIRDLDDEQWEVGLKSKLMGQINLVRYGRANTHIGFILTGGALAYSPWPRTSAIATVNAAIEGFVKGAAADLRHEKRVVVVHPPLLSETAQHMGMDPSKFPGADEVARTYLDALNSDSTGTAFFLDGYPPRR